MQNPYYYQDYGPKPSQCSTNDTTQYPEENTHHQPGSNNFQP